MDKVKMSEAQAQTALTTWLRQQAGYFTSCYVPSMFSEGGPRFLELEEELLELHRKISEVLDWLWDEDPGFANELEILKDDEIKETIINVREIIAIGDDPVRSSNVSANVRAITELELETLPKLVGALEKAAKALEEAGRRRE